MMMDGSMDVCFSERMLYIDINFDLFTQGLEMNLALVSGPNEQ